MEPKEFARWVERMVAERGLTRTEVAALLGTSPVQLTRWSSYPAPPYIGLAIAALMHDLGPWRGRLQKRRA